MAEKENSLREPLHIDVPGDRERVRAILAQWGVEASSILRLMRERPEVTPRTFETAHAVPEARPPQRGRHGAAS